MIIETGKNFLPVEKAYLEWAGKEIATLAAIKADLLDVLERITRYGSGHRLHSDVILIQGWSERAIAKAKEEYDE